MQKTITITLPENAIVSVEGVAVKAVDYKAEKALSVFTPTNNIANPVKQATEEALYLVGLAELKSGKSVEDTKRAIANAEECIKDCFCSFGGAVVKACKRVYKYTPEKQSYLAFYRDVENVICKADYAKWHKAPYSEDYIMLAAMRVMLYHTAKELNITSKSTKAAIKKSFLDYAYAKIKPFYVGGSITKEQFADAANAIKETLNSTPTNGAFTKEASYDARATYYSFFAAVPAKEYNGKNYAFQGVMWELQDMLICLPHIKKFLQTLSTYKPQPLTQQVSLDYNPFI